MNDITFEEFWNNNSNITLEHADPELVKMCQAAYQFTYDKLVYKLQCCANCADNHFGHKCSKGQTGECTDYSCWKMHSYDGVSM